MPNRRLVTVSLACAVVSTASLIALATLQYGMPTRFYAIMGLGRENVPHFREALGLRFQPLSIPVFIFWFRALLAVSWLGYLAAVIAAFKGGVPSPKVILGIAIIVGIVLAIWWPASLSGDVYGYAAFARMSVLHGLNPYTNTPDALKALGDPSGAFARFRHTTLYGPAWTLLSTAIIVVLKWAGLWWQVIALKLLAAASLVLSAVVGRGIAEKLSPGRGNLTLLAIALNPLFLVEAAGNGHNDAFMMLLLLCGILLLLREKRAVGFLMLGLSFGVKFVTAPMLCWMLMEQSRGKRIVEGARRTGIGALAMIVPCILCYAPFWHGMAIFSGAAHRWRWGLIWSSASKHATITYWLAKLMPGREDRIASFLTSPWPVFVIFLALTAWIWRRRGERDSLIAWPVLAGCLALFTMGVPFPWYFMWGWTVSLLRWNRAHLAMSGVFLLAGFIATMGYTVPR